MNHGNVLILCSDLFFSTQLTSAVKRAGKTSMLALSQQSCLERLREKNVCWLVIDLEQNGLDLAALKEAAGEGCRVIAFGPHLRTDLLENAAQIGCEFVVTRGQAARQLESVLQTSSHDSRDL